MAREDVANALSVMDEGDEQDLNAEAFADMAMSGIDMHMDRNSRPMDQSSASCAAVQSAEPPPKLSAYEALKNGAVHYSRREDKMRVLQEHPVVASISSDGRTVGCKCGRSVRLNPPWYILKFEQHVASRNCTVLKQTRVQKRKRTEEQTATNIALEAGDYSLQAVDKILRRVFGELQTGEPSSALPLTASIAHHSRMYKGAMALRANPHCKRVTPDGKFVECTCARVVLLAAPWQPGQFFLHVAEKQRPKKRVKAAPTVAKRTKKGAASVETISASPRPVRAPSCTSAWLQRYTTKPSFPREIRWDVARARGFLPCPGLRDERMNAFVTLANQLTGGARSRQKVARDLFPHLFSATLDHGHAGEQDHVDSQHILLTRHSTLQQQQLLEAEKLLLHDVIEGEALWFVDKDGNSVRSLDCLGIVDASSNAEIRCASCTALRSNAALRAAAASQYKGAMHMGRPRYLSTRKAGSGRKCSLLEAEFDMQEPYAKVLRDLALADLPSAFNTWMEVAALGLSGEFESHAVLLGLIEAMVRRTDKEHRRVGLQNVTYSDQLDAFLRSLTDTSVEACELFQRHLGGHKPRQVKGAVSCTKRQQQFSNSRTDQDEQVGVSLDDDTSNSLAERTMSDDRFVHFLESSTVGLSVPHLSINDMQDVDLVPFATASTIELQSSHESEDLVSTASPVAMVADSATLADSFNLSAIESARNELARQNDSVNEADNEEAYAKASLSRRKERKAAHEDANEQLASESSAVAFLIESPPCQAAKATGNCEIVLPTDHVPCTGLRDENVQAYVSNAVQIVGGSRPRYVIARELFPRVFGNDKKVRIVDKLTDDQRLVLQDAVFSECLWRVDKEGRCVRSLRCKRFVPATDHPSRPCAQARGVCRACRDLRTVPNFRSVLCRSKVPKKLENIKYVPSVYTESDPFLRKLSKNAAFRGLYQTVKHTVAPRSGTQGDVDVNDRERAHFWLHFARMGVCGHFQSHPVFEGLMKSMVEMKDKERRGVGKQNMQYSRPLDEFMQRMVQVSTEAFELFAGHFCGRTLRSQKVKRRSMVSTAPAPTCIATDVAISDGTITHEPLPSFPTLSSHQHHQYLMPPDDLLGGRSLSSEESQRFLDRMLDEVRLSVSQEVHLAEEAEHRCKAGDATLNDDDDTNRLGPEAYLNDDGVLTTEI